MLPAEVPFRFWMRVDEGHQSCGFRFEMAHGRGVVSLRIPGREEPAPVSNYEELDVPVEAVRGGRFLHVLPSTNRRSYALSNLTPELLGRMGVNRWVELEAVIEHGFRYLSVPSDAVSIPAASVAVADPVHSSTPAAPVPPHQTPMTPSLAREALSRLSHQDALNYLQQEMAKVELLHQHVAELQRKLTASEAREKDLLTVLQRWQQH